MADDPNVPPKPAIEPESFASSQDGTLFLAGKHCNGKAAVEIWDPAGNSQIVMLDAWFEGGPFMLAGPGDVLWMFAGNRFVQHARGKLEAMPTPAGARRATFVSAERVLHAVFGRTLHRWRGGAWEPVGRFVHPPSIDSIVLIDGVFWATASRRLHKLEPKEGLEISDACQTPFVYLYDVSWKAEPNYTFPTTRKALAGFEHLKDIRLVDYEEGSRRLGIVAPSRAVGEAVVAHVKANMKDESPELICYAPRKERAIKLP